MMLLLSLYFIARISNLLVQHQKFLKNVTGRELPLCFIAEVIFPLFQQTIKLFVAKNRTSSSVLSNSLDTPIHVASR